jgi:hypothetical protein
MGNVVLLPQFLERLFGRNAFAAFHRREPLADSDHRFRLIDQFEHLLIGFGALNDDLGLAVDGQDDRPACTLQLADQRHGIPLEA